MVQCEALGIIPLCFHIESALTGTKIEHTVVIHRTVENFMARHLVSALRDLWELASLGAFVTMIALTARAFGA
jgi:hypothetical protein